jgi:hypothetical protein
MKLADLYQEHERAMHREADVIPVTELVARLSASKQLPHTISTGSISLALYRFEHDTDHHEVILVDRLSQSAPLGYIQIGRPHSSERWQVISVWLKPTLRKQGIITNLYRCLTSEGYRLQSGDGLSSEAEKVWQALGKAGVAKVLDKSTDKIEDFSDKPIGDGDMATGKPPRFYWVTEGQKLLTICHRGGFAQLAECLDEWLKGQGPGGRFALGGMTSVGIEAEI